MAIRTEEVLSPTSRAETWAVLRVAFLVAFCAATAIALERGAAEAKPPAVSDAEVASLVSQLDPRVSFRDLSAADQRAFGQIREGILEAENLRGASGRWPGVEELAQAGIPPFAEDPLKRARTTWSYLRQGTAVNYVGTPAGGDRAGFLVLILEPDPGTPVDPLAKSDEVHHKLADGTVLHVSVFTGPPLPKLAEPISEPPIAKGWRRITAN